MAKPSLWHILYHEVMHANPRKGCEYRVSLTTVGTEQKPYKRQITSSALSNINAKAIIFKGFVNFK